MFTEVQYSHWLTVAKRMARRADEAPDLLHNALISAISAGRQELSNNENAAWFHGVLRNLSVMEARTSARRKKRDANHSFPQQTEQSSPDELQAWLDAVAGLPRGARSVAVLALHGLNRAEIMNILDLTDTAFRQRLTSIRKLLSADRPADLPKVRSTVRTQLELGLLRRALLSVLQHEGDLGTHDPDGHLIVVTKKGSHRRISRQH